MFINRSILSSAVVGMGAVFALSCATSDVILSINGVPDTLQIVSIDIASGAATLSELSLVVGDTAALTVNAFNVLAEPLGNPDVVWASSSPGVASVSTEGVVVAFAAGETTISATADSLVANVPTIVAADTLQIVSIQVWNGPTRLGRLSLDEGETETLAATAFNALGNPLGVEIGWASSSPGVASVSTQGLVAALAAGSTTISATADAVVANVPTTVSAVGGPPPPGVGGIYDPYLPAAWTDTVHYEDFTGLETAERLDSFGEQSIAGTPFSLVKTWDSGCTGGAGPSGYGGDLCKVQDSVVFANQPTPPWVWEHRLPENSNRLIYTLDFADGNGPAAAESLTRLYIRFSIFYEDSTVGVGQTTYQFHSSSNKWWNLNGAGQGMLQNWRGGAPMWVDQSSPNTETCPFGLQSNTWNEYYPGDTATTTTDGGLPCPNRGLGAWQKTGLWQHHFLCVDFSPAAGSRVMSWGVKDADVQGISGYHNNVTDYSQGGATDFDSFFWNGTYGGTPKTHPAQSYWFDDLLIMTGSTGSCVTPPSFS